MNKKVSIIVPIFNAENYLAQCIDSILCQTYENLEVVLVDDASTDRSLFICQEYLKKDKRLVLIQKNTNEGLGYARNTGILHASGEYCIFVDSDDFIENNMIELMMNAINKDKLDACFCSFYEYYSNGTKVFKRKEKNELLFHDDAIINNFLLGMIGTEASNSNESLFSMSVCMELFNLDILKKYNIMFRSERLFISEDILFQIEYLPKTRAICFLDEPLYNYRFSNPYSLTHTFDENELQKQKVQYIKMRELLNKVFENDCIFDERLKRYFLGRIRTLIVKSVVYSKTKKNFKLNQYIKTILNDELVSSTISSYPYKNNPFKLKLFNFAIKSKSVFFVKLFVSLRMLKKHRRF